MIIRPAEEADVPQILDLIEQGTRESAFEGTYDRERATDYVRTHMHWDEAAAIVAIDDNEELAGGFIAIASHEMWRERLCGLCKFWVLQRRSPVARSLVNRLIEFARERECMSIYVSATAQLARKEQKLFENLLTRAGFDYAGAVMKRNM